MGSVHDFIFIWDQQAAYKVAFNQKETRASCELLAVFKEIGRDGSTNAPIIRKETRRLILVPVNGGWRIQEEQRIRQ